MRLSLLSAISIGLILTGATLWIVMRHTPETRVFEQSGDRIESDTIEWEEDEESDPTAPPEAHGPDSPLQPSPLIEILPSDCSGECGNFSAQPDRYTYCRSVCGLTLTNPEDGVTARPADPALQKSLEQKEAAIQKSDLAACDQIADEQLKRSCQVRVTEDLLE